MIKKIIKKEVKLLYVKNNNNIIILIIIIIIIILKYTLFEYIGNYIIPISNFYNK